LQPVVVEPPFLDQELDTYPGDDVDGQRVREGGDQRLNALSCRNSGIKEE
jgi:hypothetical protein